MKSETEKNRNKKLNYVKSLKSKMDKDIIKRIDMYVDGIYDKFRDYPNELLEVLTLYVSIVIKNQKPNEEYESWWIDYRISQCRYHNTNWKNK